MILLITFVVLIVFAVYVWVDMEKQLKKIVDKTDL